MNLDDLIGVKFNMLEVISYSHNKDKGGKQRGKWHYYNCKCDCGNDTIATREQIHQRLKISCGCKKEKKP